MAAQHLAGRLVSRSRVCGCVRVSSQQHGLSRLGQVWGSAPVIYLLALLPEDATSSAAPPPLVLPALGRKEKLMALRRSRRLLCSETRRCVGASAAASCCPGCFLLPTTLGGLLPAAPPSTAKDATAGDLAAGLSAAGAVAAAAAVADAAASAAAAAAAFAAAAASLACCARAAVMSQNSGLHRSCQADIKSMDSCHSRVGSNHTTYTGRILASIMPRTRRLWKPVAQGQRLCHCVQSCGSGCAANIDHVQTLDQPAQRGVGVGGAHLSAALSAQQRRMSCAYSGGQLSGTSGRRLPCTTLNITCTASTSVGLQGNVRLERTPA